MEAIALKQSVDVFVLEVWLTILINQLRVVILFAKNRVGANCLRLSADYSDRWYGIFKVVQVATPTPKKSASSVQIGQFNANAERELANHLRRVASASISLAPQTLQAILFQLAE